MKQLVPVVAVTLLAFPIADASAGTSWYAGLTGGASSLRPETTNSPFKIDSSVSFGGGFFVGYDYSARFSFEAGYNYLGAATLSSENGKNDIEYSALSAGALMYVWGDEIDIAERNGFAGYLRFGLNAMSNSSSIPLEQEDNVGILAGVGVEWPIGQNLNVRGELTSFDGDAHSARLAVLYRLHSNAQSASGAGTSVAPVVVTPAREQQDSMSAQQNADPIPETSFEQSQAEQPQVEQPQNKIEPTAQSIADNSCVPPAPNEPIDAQGCGLFGGLLTGVDFASGTANLTSAGSRQLDRLSSDLLRYESILIEIQAHTEAFGNAQRANQIAKQRTIAIARYLVGRGVPVSRLKARAFGHSRPLASDNTVAGRKQNNRIELRVLP